MGVVSLGMAITFNVSGGSTLELDSLLVLDDDGVSDKKSDSNLYYAAYWFSSVLDKQAAYNDLVLKLSSLYGTGVILIIVFVVRSLPTGTRSGISALRQIDKSIEESAYDMGANSLKVFTSVTLPLIKDSFLSGLVTAFVRSITAISAIILLVTPSYLLITVQINEFAEKGSFSIACAFATILILITYGAVLLMNLFIKFFGTSRKQKEVD